GGERGTPKLSRSPCPPQRQRWGRAHGRDAGGAAALPGAGAAAAAAARGRGLAGARFRGPLAGSPGRCDPLRAAGPQGRRGAGLPERRPLLAVLDHADGPRGVHDEAQPAGRGRRGYVRAHSLADSQKALDHVSGNLDVLEQHMAHRRGEEVHSALSYRRRHSGMGSAVSKTSEDSHGRPPQEEAVTRPRLVHQRPRLPRARRFKRRSVADLDKASAEPRKQRAVLGAPFVLRDGMKGWRMLETWNKTWRQELQAVFPRAVTDFYPYNMLSRKRQSPYLSRLPVGIFELTASERQSRFDPVNDKGLEAGRYMHLQLTPKMWAALEEKRHFPADRHTFLRNDEWQMNCMSEEIQEEWNLKTHWKIILVGSRGAGMFNHSDSLHTSSWHAHVMGDKWWYVCGSLLNGTHVCFEDILKPGEILYYPPRWHHETQCLSTPTMTLTDTVAHAYNAEGIWAKTYGECTGRQSLRFDFSAQLCDALGGKCEDHWRERSREAGRAWSGQKLAPWRTNARVGEVSKKEAIKPTHNNYDGRNHIAETWN
ncbi:unnamed protein product, partial [Prorocentrum cordatum]